MLKSIFNKFLFLFAGILEEKIFEADPNIKYTFAWDRMNIYRQRVYGVTTANIKVYRRAVSRQLLEVECH